MKALYFFYSKNFILLAFNLKINIKVNYDEFEDEETNCFIDSSFYGF